jgi:DNA-directed RNA polymerase specialized sigma24 family protein
VERLPELATSHDAHHAKLVLEVGSLLEQLAPDERSALLLHRVHGFSLSESAEVSGMSISTFKRRLSRGEKRFLSSAAHRDALAPWLGPKDSVR